MRPSSRSVRAIGASLFVLAAYGCGDARPSADAAATASAGVKAAGSSSAAASSKAVPSAAVATASAASSAAAPAVARPKVVTSCDKAPARFGGFTPALEDVVAAGRALAADVCIPRADLEQAIRACAAETGATELSIFADAGETTGCHVTIQGGKDGDHRWIVFLGTFRRGPVFDAGATTVELDPTPHVYLDALGKHSELCPMTSSTGKPPAELPPGWKELSAAAKDFVCSGVIADVPAEP